MSDGNLGHTAGPWELGRQGIMAADGKPLFVTGSDGTLWWRNDADASVAVAAADLLEALKLVANSGKFTCFDDAAWDAVNTAIAKATQP